MEINFRDICGNSYTLNLSENAKVSDACKLLSQKTGINENQIILVSMDEDRSFYQDNEMMLDVSKENPDFIHFLKHMNNFHQSLIDNKQTTKQSLKAPHESFFNTLHSAQNWQYTDFYDEYSTVVNGIPADFQDRVNQIAELGYPIEDIKEALRTTDYDVMVAIHLLILVKNNIFDEIGDEYDNEYDDEYESIDDDSEIEIEYVKNIDDNEIPNEKDNSLKQNSNNDIQNINTKQNELDLKKQNEINQKDLVKIDAIANKQAVKASSEDDHESI